MNYRENYLRNARMQGPEFIPSTVVISGASWAEHKQDMLEVVRRHPSIFRRYYQSMEIDFDRMTASPGQGEEKSFTDAWGCVWRFPVEGLEGIVAGHPLADWAAMESYRAPDPVVEADRGPANWAAVEEQVRQARTCGALAYGATPHGFLFDRLTYLRGFENMMLDMAGNAPQLPRLVDILLEHNRALVAKWLSLELDVLEFADDLGTQQRSFISPAMMHRWLTPVYHALMTPCREASTLVVFHSDGYILNLIDEFIAAGVDIINPQDLVNGIDNLAREVKGRMCIRLDIDRQKIVPYGTCAEIRELIQEEVRVLGDPRGGLEFIAGIYPPTTPDRVDALTCALEEFSTYWWRG